jgi:folate-dependent phosphoribosylglycinamide formyltransferase PurN
MINAILLTGDQQRHQFAATRLAARLNLAGIVSETKSPAVAAPDGLSVEDRDTIAAHFAERDAVERSFFGDVNRFPETGLLPIATGAINSPEVFSWIEARAPEVVLLYGSGIVKAPLLDAYEGRIINLHLGLSPYYRGSGTNFWPLVHRQPECVGATIHLAVREVDAGNILTQVRPEAAADDRAHHLGTKTLLAALDALPEVVHRYLAGEVRPQAQDLSLGRTFRQRDFNADAVRAMWRHVETGMMAEYIADGAQRQARFPIVIA